MKIFKNKETTWSSLAEGKDIKKWLRLIVSGIMAGISISIGGVATIFMNSSFFGTPLKAALLFPIGIFLTYYFGLDLYTGKIGYLLENRNKEYVIKILVIVVSNLLGTIFFGYLMHFMYKGQLASLTALQKIGETRVMENSFVGFLRVFVSSMFGCAFVHVAVDLCKRMKSDFGKILALWLPVTAFVYFGYDHSIANMFYFSFLGDLSAKRWLYVFVNVIGNGVGGLLTHLLIMFVAPKKAKTEVAIDESQNNEITIEENVKYQVTIDEGVVSETAFINQAENDKRIDNKN
jgi:formate/nitrite transporter FocA (FNT family)